MNDTQKGTAQQVGHVLEAALDYHRRGWSIVPIAPETKKPPRDLSWKPYQSQPPDEAKLRAWFAKGKYQSLAVILGKVSGGLVCRDFDAMESYERWAQEHPDLARTLPTVATHRGRHVSFLANFEGCRSMDDGELRGAGHYCVLPPSPHPEGTKYRWLVPLPDGPIPFVQDVEAADLFSSPTPYREDRADGANGVDRADGVHGAYGSGTEGYRAIGGGVCVATEKVELELDDDINRLIAQTLENELPPRVGTRDNRTWPLARALKAVPTLYSAEAGDLKPFVRHWHALGVERGVIGTLSFDIAWAAFIRAWPKVKFPKGDDPMKAILELAARSPLPPAAKNYDSEPVQRLVAICKALQGVAGDKPFFIACRVAGELIGVHYTTAADLLYMLCNDHPPVLTLISKGDRAKRRASRYRYIAD